MITQVKIASTKIDGIGPNKAIQVCYQLGISDNNPKTKVNLSEDVKIHKSYEVCIIANSISIG